MNAVALPPEADIDRRTCEVSLYRFIRAGWHALLPNDPYVDAWHIGCLAEHLQAVTNLEIRNLIINVPPGAMKSLSAAVFWPCWEWATRPATQWLFVTYSEELALRDAKRCLDLIGSEWYQRRWGAVFQVRGQNPAAGRFDNSQTGYRLTTTPSGSRGTGDRVDRGVADDPHKIIEAYSKARKAEVCKFWDETMSGRARDPKTFCKVVLMQRVAGDDLCGHLKEVGGYEMLVLPMEHEPHRIFLPGASGAVPPKDPIIPTALQRRRPELMDPREEEGDLLWPERFGRAEVDALKLALRAYGTASQLQQRPAPAEGTIFNRAWFGYFTEEAEGGQLFFVLQPRGENAQPRRVPAARCYWFQTCDTALTTEATSSYTAVGTFVVTPEKDLLVYDVYRERLEVPKQFPALLRQRQRYPQLAFQAIESKASGHGLLQMGRMHGVPFRELKADVDKVRRSSAVATLYENGKVYHRAGTPWLTDFEDCLLSFPTGTSDDMVDCLSYGGVLLVTDAMFNLKIDGDLVLYPPPPAPPKPGPHGASVRVAGRTITINPEHPPDDRPPGEDEAVVGGRRVRFADEGEDWFRR